MPIGFIAQLQGDAEVAAKMNSLGGAFGSFDQRVQAVNTSTGQTLPKSLDATASAAGRAGTAVESSGKSVATAALGFASAASGAFALYNQYDRLEKISVRIAQTEKAVTAAQRAGLDSKRALNDLQAKGVTSGAQYESAVLRVSQAQQQAEIATDRLAIAQNDLTQGQVGFALQVLPTVFSAVQGVSTAMTLLKTAHVGVSLASVVTTGTMVAGTGALGGFTFATNAATIGTQKLSMGMRLLQLAMGPVGWIILGIGTAMTLFATNAFGFRDAVDSATEAIGKFFPFMKPVLDTLLALAHMAFPDAAESATEFSEETEFATQQAAAATVSNTNKMSDALDKIKDKFKELGKSTEATKTKPLAATEEDDPFMEKMITGISGKRQKLSEAKLAIIQEIGLMTTGVRTKLEDLPTDVPGLDTLIEKIRTQLSSTFNIDFDFNAEDMDVEYAELMEALTRNQEPLSIEMQIKHDTLQKDLDSITAKIETTEENIRSRAGGRGLEELRESLAAGTLTGEGDEFIVFMLERLDDLGEKAVTIKEQLRDITHVAFTPATAAGVPDATSTKTIAEATATWKANREVTEGIEERIEAMERLQGIIEGRAITPLTDAARKDAAGLAALAKDQQAAINEFFESIGSKERLDFGVAPEKLQNEVQQVINALIQAESEGSGITTELAANATQSFDAIATASATGAATVDTSMTAMSGSVTTSAGTINSSVFEMRGAFLNSFTAIGDAADTLAERLDKSLSSVIAAMKDVKGEMDGLGMGKSSKEGGGLGKESRVTGRGSRPPEITIKNDINLDSQQMKSFSRKAVVENFSDNL